MRVMVIISNTPASEAVPPPTGTLEAMGRFNEELVNAGVLLAGDGLTSSARGARVRFDGDRRTVTDGPFTEAKELVAGYWIWQVRSLDEAIEWLKQAPFGGGMEVEIRPVAEPDDFGAELTPELRAQDARLRATGESRA
ncbi:MAG TPA: YciI family protein [Candidatus Dormibacteraeota bacterium]|nr:YciI family protein [Candidatus Dormibacteraeota bacterium]